MKIDHITLLVSSFERSMPYYDALLPLLGFSKQRERIWTDGEGFFIQFGEARGETRPYERYGAGMNHIGFGAPRANPRQDESGGIGRSGDPESRRGHRPVHERP